ncbi:MAG: RNA polymerase sigma factor [Gammaproteobacteria bacterium]
MTDDLDFRRRLEHCVRGDAAAVEALFEHWVYPRASVHVRRLEMDSDKHEDFCQDIAIKFLKSLPQLRARDERGAAALLKRIAYSVITDAVRVKDRHASLDISELDASLPTEEADPEGRTHMDGYFRKAIICLREQHAPCVDLLAQVAEGLKVRELAERLKTSEGAIRTRLWDCRKRLSDILGAMDSEVDAS